ncbi:MAG: hypothetical protein WC449_04335 [Candidatus Paceibacterota bacterium]
MPYITKSARDKLDPHIEAIAQAISEQTKETKDELSLAGMVNYVCTRIALLSFRKVLGKFRYKWIALFTGILENIKQEFHDRVVKPYEAEANWKHGDLPEFIQAAKDLNEEIEFSRNSKAKTRPRPPKNSP